MLYVSFCICIYSVDGDFRNLFRRHGQKFDGTFFIAHGVEMDFYPPKSIFRKSTFGPQ